MRSRFENIKQEVIAYRKKGASLNDIQEKYGVPKSTQNYWFRGITLSPRHKRALQKRHENALITARREAVKWHNSEKQKRLEVAKSDALYSLSKIDMTHNETLELALAILYLGEGAKKNGSTSLGNSDPLILNFFVQSLKKLYKLQDSDFKCELHIRADQDELVLKRYWSNTLQIPLCNFLGTSIDKRTVGRKTYPHYKGVCIVRCGRVAIMRKLMYIANTFCEHTASKK